MPRSYAHVAVGQRQGGRVEKEGERGREGERERRGGVGVGERETRPRDFIGTMLRDGAEG